MFYVIKVLRRVFSHSDHAEYVCGWGSEKPQMRFPSVACDEEFQHATGFSFSQCRVRSYLRRYTNVYSNTRKAGKPQQRVSHTSIRAKLFSDIVTKYSQQLYSKTLFVSIFQAGACSTSYQTHRLRQMVADTRTLWGSLLLLFL